MKMSIEMKPEGTLESLEQAMIEHGLFVESIKIEHLYNVEGDFVVEIGFFYGVSGRGRVHASGPVSAGLWMVIQGAVQSAVEEKYRPS